MFSKSTNYKGKLWASLQWRNEVSGQSQPFWLTAQHVAVLVAPPDRWGHGKKEDLFSQRSRAAFKGEVHAIYLNRSWTFLVSESPPAQVEFIQHAIPSPTNTNSYRKDGKLYYIGAKSCCKQGLSWTSQRWRAQHLGPLIIWGFDTLIHIFLYRGVCHGPEVSRNYVTWKKK